MMGMQEAAQAMGGELRGADQFFERVTTDSRQLHKGDLFVALQGDRFDGHAFAGEALAQGAAGVVVSEPVAAHGNQILVPNTRLALGALAAHWRSRFDMPVLAVTGSNGKTTVKQMLAAICEALGPGVATQGNLNNDIGVPLTLLRLRDGDRWAVIEMGANHAGEIAYLTGLARPDVALVNNAAPAHLEGFGSLADVVQAKSEIYSGLRSGGVAIVNADDAHASVFKKNAAPHRVRTFGMRNAADVSADSASVRYHFAAEACEIRFQLCIDNQTAPIAMPLLGRHNVMNALAASAVAHAIGSSLKAIAAGLSQVRPVEGRLQLKNGTAGLRIIDDSYNANPGSVGAAIEVLAAAQGARVLVLGDMAELGPDAASLHRQVGEAARAAGIDALYATGELSRHSVEAFGETGRHFANRAALVDALLQDVRGGRFASAVVLVKGSRSSRMDAVVDALLPNDTGRAQATNGRHRVHPVALAG